MIELVVSLAILGLLASMALPMGEVIIQRNKEQELHKDLRQIRDAIDAYKIAYDEGRILKEVGSSGYPPNLAVLEEGVQDAKSPKEQKIYFLRRVPKDPFASEDTNAIESWGLRSYESSGSSPQKGNDVFDIYSMSDGTGLNGVPYRDW